MNLNHTIIALLSILKRKCENDTYLSVNDREANLQIDNESLLNIGEDSMLLLGNKEISHKIRSSSVNDPSYHVDYAQFETFCSAVDIVRLNHLGINYSVADVKQEIAYYKDLLSGTHYKLYEEYSGSETQKWLFVGNTANWESPLFEIVLSKSDKPVTNEWVPHFQIDIDTRQSIEELRELTATYIKPNFFGWELDVPHYGVVLAMGKLGNIGGTSIYLGMGTNKRDTQLHHEKELKLV